MMKFGFFIIAGWLLIGGYAGSLKAQSATTDNADPEPDTALLRKNLIHFNVVSALLKEAEISYERLFFEGKLGINPFASRYIGNFEPIRGRRARNYSGGLNIHYYFAETGIVRFAAGAGIELGNYTNEQIVTEVNEQTGFDPSQRQEQFTFYYGRLGILLTPNEHFNIGMFSNLGQRDNRRRTNRDSFFHPHFFISAVLRL